MQCAHHLYVHDYRRASTPLGRVKLETPRASLKVKRKTRAEYCLQSAMPTWTATRKLVL